MCVHFHVSNKTQDFVCIRCAVLFSSSFIHLLKHAKQKEVQQHTFGNDSKAHLTAINTSDCLASITAIRSSARQAEYKNNFATGSQK